MMDTVPLWEIHKFKKFTGFLIQKLPFAWWVREIAQSMKRIVVSSHCPPHFTTGSRGICSKPLQGCKSVHSTHEGGYIDDERHPTGPQDLGGYG